MSAQITYMSTETARAFLGDPDARSAMEVGAVPSITATNVIEVLAANMPDGGELRIARNFDDIVVAVVSIWPGGEPLFDAAYVLDDGRVGDAGTNHPTYMTVEDYLGAALAQVGDPQALEPRYRYEPYSDPYGNTNWARRAQWLVFDRNGVGCFASFGTEREAALTTAALNAFEASGAAGPFENDSWRAAR